jgi:ligand-binding sensor domain-containing protein
MISWCLGSLAVLAAVGVTQRLVMADPDPRYKPGDWRAFTSMRFVTSAVVTIDYIYFGTSGGVARYDRNAQKWVDALTTAEGLPSNSVLRLAYDDLTDELFAETPAGNSVYRRIWDEWRFVQEFPDSLVQNWRSTNLLNLQLPFGYDALQPGYIRDPHLRSYRIVGDMPDTYGNEWIGTWGGFVWLHPSAMIDLTPQQWGLYHDNVEAIFIDTTSIFFAGPDYYDVDGALSIYDTVASSWQYIESHFTDGFASDAIHRFAGEPGGRYLWMATDLGVVKYDRQKSSFRTFGRASGLSDERVNALCLDGDILWVGTETGVEAIYTPSDSVFSASSPDVQDASVNAIVVTDDIVWLGTNHGLFRLVKPEPTWTRFDRSDGALSRSVRALCVHGDQLYVGMDRGLGMVDLTMHKPARVYEAADGLPDDNIFDVAVTDSIVWAATRTGLVRFVPATRERRVIGVSDGLLSTQVQTIAVDGDYLWLGTANGVSRFRWNNPYRID